MVYPCVGRLAFALWDPHDLSAFQNLALVTSALAAVGIYIGTGLMLAHIQRERETGAGGSGKVRSQLQQHELDVCKFAKGVVVHTNFLRFVAMNAVRGVVGSYEQANCLIVCHRPHIVRDELSKHWHKDKSADLSSGASLQVLEAENVLHGQFRKTFVDLLLGTGPAPLMASASARANLLTAIPVAAQLTNIGLYSYVKVPQHCVQHCARHLQPILISDVTACGLVWPLSVRPADWPALSGLLELFQGPPPLYLATLYSNL